MKKPYIGYWAGRYHEYAKQWSASLQFDHTAMRGMGYAAHRQALASRGTRVEGKWADIAVWCQRQSAIR